MGATNFACTSVGRDAEAAFQEARKYALHMYGHAGYTGSIAEKGNYVELALPSRMTARKFEELVTDAQTYADYDDAYSLSFLRKTVEEAKPGTVRMAKSRLREAEKLIAKQKKERERFWRSIPAKHHDLIRKAANIADDKWGPAACVELRGEEAKEVKVRHSATRTRKKAYMFFGMASC